MDNVDQGLNYYIFKTNACVIYVPGAFKAYEYLFG